MDRDAEAVGVKAESIGRGDELPCQRNRLTLEIVTKREVAQHLEEGEVPAGLPDLLEIVVLATGTHALLARSGPDIRTRVLPKEGALELHHASIGEQERGIVGRNQGRRRYFGVPLGREIIEELASNLGGIHSPAI